jgi:hypothetical protein
MEDSCEYTKEAVVHSRLGVVFNPGYVNSTCKSPQRLAFHMELRVWHGLVNILLKLAFQLKTGDFLSRWLTTGFLKLVELIIETCLINMPY